MHRKLSHGSSAIGMNASAFTVALTVKENPCCVDAACVSFHSYNFHTSANLLIGGVKVCKTFCTTFCLSRRRSKFSAVALCFLNPPVPMISPFRSELAFSCEVFPILNLVSCCHFVSSVSHVYPTLPPTPPGCPLSDPLFF